MSIYDIIGLIGIIAVGLSLLYFAWVAVAKMPKKT